jgi:hypothetical protein
VTWPGLVLGFAFGVEGWQNQGTTPKSVPIFVPMMKLRISQTKQRRGFAPFR